MDFGGKSASSGRASLCSALGRSGFSERELEIQFEDFVHHASLFGGSSFSFGSRNHTYRFTFGPCRFPILPNHFAEERREISERYCNIPTLEVRIVDGVQILSSAFSAMFMITFKIG